MYFATQQFFFIPIQCHIPNLQTFTLTYDQQTQETYVNQNTPVF